MKRDIRTWFKEDSKLAKGQMPEGHEARFIKKLDKELPVERSNSFFFLRIAASMILFLGLGYVLYTQFGSDKVNTQVVDVNDKQSPMKSLGDISPDLKKIETYYLASINMELAKMNYAPENMELIDGYFKRLAQLNKEYDRLNLELSDTGPNIETVEALINNLKLRLNLLQRLKDQLNELNINHENTI